MLEGEPTVGLDKLIEELEMRLPRLDVEFIELGDKLQEFQETLKFVKEFIEKYYVDIPEKYQGRIKQLEDVIGIVEEKLVDNIKTRVFVKKQLSFFTTQYKAIVDDWEAYKKDHPGIIN